MKTKRAFTLVEILTVIVIISILAALVTAAVAGAMRAGKRAAIATEMSHNDMAIEQYKAEFGEYPPDFFDDEALLRHVKKRWPRFDISGVSAGNIRNAMSIVFLNRDVYPQTLLNEWGGVPGETGNFPFSFTDPATDISALALWLGGFPNREGRFEGFSADTEAPFGRDSVTNVPNRGVVASGLPITVDPSKVIIGTPDKKVFGELEINKNVFFFNFGRGYNAFCVGTKSGSTAFPIVYFRGRADGGVGSYCDYRNPSEPGAPPKIKSYNFGANVVAGGSVVWQDCGVVVPYARSGAFADDSIVWQEPTKYQLIHPGLDGVFGVLGAAPRPFERIISTGFGIGALDLDNLTNFAGSKELKSILP